MESFPWNHSHGIIPILIPFPFPFQHLTPIPIFRHIYSRSLPFPLEYLKAEKYNTYTYTFPWEFPFPCTPLYRCNTKYFKKYQNINGLSSHYVAASTAAGDDDDWRPPTPDAAVHRSSTIGGSQVLDCDLSRQQVPLASVSGASSLTTERIITWRRRGKEVPIFIQFNGYPPHVDEMYQVCGFR